MNRNAFLYKSIQKIKDELHGEIDDCDEVINDEKNDLILRLVVSTRKKMLKQSLVFFKACRYNDRNKAEEALKQMKKHYLTHKNQLKKLKSFQLSYYSSLYHKINDFKQLIFSCD